MAVSSEIVVAARDLTKRYSSKVTALDSLTLDIRRGEIFALLGPNGAGKTTFISIVAGLVKRTSGSVTVLGLDVERDYLSTRRAIGLVPQEVNFDPFFSVAEVLRFQRGYFGLPPDEAQLDELLRALDLSTKKDTNTRALSGGMKRRLLIAKALVHDPPIVFLDEPTAGVDVKLRRDLWAYVQRRRAAGTTFILTTHYLEEAQQLADRIGVIDKGQLLLLDETRALLERLGRRTLTVVPQAQLTEVPPSLVALGARLLDGGKKLVCAYAGEDHGAVSRILAAIGGAGIEVRDLETATPNLEEIFVDLVGRSPAA